MQPVQWDAAIGKAEESSIGWRCRDVPADDIPPFNASDMTLLEILSERCNVLNDKDAVACDVCQKQYAD